MKKIIVVGSVVLSTFIFSGCSNQVAQVMNSGVGQNVASNNVNIQTNRNCIPRLSGGNVGMMGVITELAFNTLAEEALKSIEGMEDVKIPKKIMDTCEADARLKYVESISNRYFESLNVVNTKILESLEQTKEVNQIKADIADQKNIEDRAQLNEGIAENAEKIQELLENAKIKDRKKISEAQGIFFKSMPKYTALLVGWDKEIASFGKDNLPWAIQNFGAMKTILTQLKTVSMLAVNGKTTLEKFIESNNIKIDTGAANRAAKAMIKEDKKVIAQSEEAFSEEFNG